MVLRLMTFIGSLLLVVTPVFSQTLPDESEVITEAAAKAVSFNVVYLVDPAAEIDPAVSVEKMQTYFHAQQLDSWDDVLVYQDVLPIDAIIIHASAVKFIDQTWTAEAYKRGVVFAALDIDARTFSEIVGDKSLQSRYELSRSDVDFVVAYRFSTDSTNSSGSLIGAFSVPEDRLAFIHGLVFDLQSIRTAKRDYLSRLFG